MDYEHEFYIKFKDGEIFRFFKYDWGYGCARRGNEVENRSITVSLINISDLELALKCLTQDLVEHTGPDNISCPDCNLLRNLGREILEQLETDYGIKKSEGIKAVKKRKGQPTNV